MFQFRALQGDEYSSEIVGVTILGGDVPEDRYTTGPAIADRRREHGTDAVPLFGTTLLDQSSFIWPDYSSRERSVLDLIAREAGGSNLFTGTTPETWSPLASLDRQNLTAFEASPIATPDKIDTSSLIVDDGDPAAVILQIDGTGFAGVAFCADRFVVRVPSGVSAIALQYSPDEGFQAGEWQALERVLRAHVDGEITPILVWRAYVGENTASVDGTSDIELGKWKRVGFAVTTRTTYLIGRVAMTINSRRRPLTRDPTRARRLAKWTADQSAIVQGCPELGSAYPTQHRAVIAVHGTMSCAIPMAMALKGTISSDVNVFRFEHDTWAPIYNNVTDLMNLLRNADQPDLDLVLVGHSRGGLIVRQVADHIRRENLAWKVQVVTLGTPFLGTPLVQAARGTVVGLRYMIGMIRVAGGPMLDVGTRLVGLMLRDPPPPGIGAMSPDADYLAPYRDYPADVDHAFAGKIDIDTQPKGYGLASLAGFGQAAFGRESNDLVVPTASALGRHASPTGHTVDCDHFTFFDQDPVRQAIQAAVSSPLPAF
jgi:hypothetical protein